MKKVDIAEFPELKHRFYEFVTKYPIVNAVISNKQNGYVYSDDNRTNLFVCAKHGWSLLLVEDSAEIGILFDFLKANMEIPDYIHLYSPDKDFINYLEGNWPKFKVRARGQFRNIENLPIINYKEILPSGFSIVEIQDIEFSKLDVFKFDLDKRYWQSKDDFMNNAIGVCIMNPKNDPAAICYSACIVDNIAEMDELVLSDYRGMGFGSIALGSSLNLATEKGLITHGDIFIANTPSIKMALRVGLQKINEYDLVSIFLRDW